MLLGGSTASPGDGEPGGWPALVNNEVFEYFVSPSRDKHAAFSDAASRSWGQGVRDKVVPLTLKWSEGGHLDGASALKLGLSTVAEPGTQRCAMGVRHKIRAQLSSKRPSVRPHAPAATGAAREDRRLLLNVAVPV